MRTLASEVETLLELAFEAAPIDPAIEAIEHQDWRARTPVGGLVRAKRTFGERASRDLADCRRSIGEEEPDVLLVDIMAWGANVAAEASGLPWGDLLSLPTAHSIPRRAALRTGTRAALGSRREAARRGSEPGRA